MRKTTAHVPLHLQLAMAVALSSFACTGVSSLPGAGGPPGSAGTNGGTPGGGAGGVSVGIGSVTPTTKLDTGRVALRRLNVAEYNNTVRDLLGTATRPADKFPSDDVNDGFDTQGDALTISDFLGEQMETAAGALVDELLGRPAADPIRTRLLVCQPTTANLQTCLTQILTGFMKSAYRRPATAAEVADIVQLGTSIAQTSGDATRGVNAALKAVLLSPFFIFHVEGMGATSANATPVNDYELANRLSYFLWSTMPDAQLMQAADATMLTPATTALSAQIDRMLADPKGQALVDNFGGQWLGTRDASQVSPDPMLFPTFDQALLTAIPQETAMFFRSLITDGKPLTTLLLADYTFVNTRLASHYGLAAAPAAFTKTSLVGSNRIGILTQGTFLTTTSNPDRTSPVKRGNWVLERMLCDPPPPPPMNVPPLVTPSVGSGQTVREALAEHRKNPFCATCHTTIDPIGLSFENFDAIAAYRTTDNGQAVDAHGVMPDGTAINGPTDLAQILARDVRFTRCVTKQMLTYAVGRSFNAPDALAYASGVAAPMENNGSWPALIHAVATSQAFLTRRGEGP